MFTVYKKFWTHYADFEGKSTRPEFGGLFCAMC